MQARRPLMVEHRLIERMIAVIRHTLSRAESTRSIDPLFIDTAIDFIRVYADRTHHGKEEHILFRASESKDLSDIDRQAMKELVEDHVRRRQVTKSLVEANEKYRNGDTSTLPVILSNLKTLVDFYPKHIVKEDKSFFPASRRYFSDEEDQAILAEFWEFDRRMIHEKYTAVVENAEKSLPERRS